MVHATLLIFPTESVVKVLSRNIPTAMRCRIRISWKYLPRRAVRQTNLLAQKPLSNKEPFRASEQQSPHHGPSRPSRGNLGIRIKIRP